MIARPALRLSCVPGARSLHARLTERHAAATPPGRLPALVFLRPALPLPPVPGMGHDFRRWLTLSLTTPIRLAVTQILQAVKSPSRPLAGPEGTGTTVVVLSPAPSRLGPARGGSAPARAPEITRLLTAAGGTALAALVAGTPPPRRDRVTMNRSGNHASAAPRLILARPNAGAGAVPKPAAAVTPRPQAPSRPAPARALSSRPSPELFVRLIAQAERTLAAAHRAALHRAGRAEDGRLEPAPPLPRATVWKAAEDGRPGPAPRLRLTTARKAPGDGRPGPAPRLRLTTARNAADEGRSEPAPPLPLATARNAAETAVPPQSAAPVQAQAQANRSRAPSERLRGLAADPGQGRLRPAPAALIFTRPPGVPVPGVTAPGGTAPGAGTDGAAAGQPAPTRRPPAAPAARLTFRQRLQSAPELERRVLQIERQVQGRVVRDSPQGAARRTVPAATALSPQLLRSLTEQVCRAVERRMALDRYRRGL